MALPGIGKRTAVSVAMEISLHLLQSVVYQTLQVGIGSGTQTATILSTVDLFPGAQLAVDTGVNAEVVTVLTVPSATTFTAVFANSHPPGAVVQGATFPLQQATDPLYTTAEVLGYIARAENQFLMDVPCYFQLGTQTVAFGQLINPVPSNAIELERVAASNTNIQLVSLTRVSNVVTAVSVDPHGLSSTQKFSVLGVTDPGWNGAFRAANIVDPVTWTYPQVASDSSTVNVGMAGLYTRLYAQTQEGLYQTDPQWRTQFATALTGFAEDRTGLYAFAVNGVPSTAFPVETLCAIRDNDTLTLLDGFLVPDPLVHIVKYKALDYAASKDGECRNPLLAQYCAMRYSRGVLAARRWLGFMSLMPTEMLQAAMAGRGR